MRKRLTWDRLMKVEMSIINWSRLCGNMEVEVAVIFEWIQKDLTESNVYVTPKICVNDWTAGRVEEQQKTWFTARPWLVLILNWTNPCMQCGAAGIYSSQSITSDCEQNAKLFDLLWKLEKYYFWSCYINWSCVKHFNISKCESLIDFKS